MSAEGYPSLLRAQSEPTLEIAQTVDDPKEHLVLRFAKMSSSDEVVVQVLNKSSKTQNTQRQDRGNRSEESGVCCSMEFYNYICVAFFAIIGCFTRIGLDRMVGKLHANIENPRSVIFQSFFSNMLGSFILGLLVASSLKKHPAMSAIYTGISTGLCGSITTYSKFNQQVSTLLIGETLPSGRSQIIGFAQIAIGIAAPICSFEVGKDLSHGIRKRMKVRSGGSSSSDGGSTWWYSFICLFLVVLWVALIILAVMYDDNQTVLIVCLYGVFAPVGAIPRYMLGKLNGSPLKCFSPGSILGMMPIGTFLANFLGSVIIAITHVILTHAVLSCPSIAVLKAIQSGLLACFTTVSTFMSEISTFRSKRNILASHCYAFLTIFLCQVAAAMINGPSRQIYLNLANPPNATVC